MLIVAAQAVGHDNALEDTPVADGFDFPYSGSTWIPYDFQNPGLTGTSPCYGVPRSALWHAGEDWRQPGGTSVRAVAHGRVVYVHPVHLDYPGGVAILEHRLQTGQLVYSMYGHLQKPSAVSQGQVVSRGDVIGAVLDWQESWGDNSHLHFEIRTWAVNSEPCPYPPNLVIAPGAGYTYPDHPNAKGYLNPSQFIQQHRPSGAVDVALILDSSGSMRTNDPRGLRKEAAKIFIGAMQATDQVAVVDFDSSVRIAWALQTLGTDKSGPLAAVDSIDSSGNTNVLAALQAGFAQLNSSAAANPKAAVFLTDGDDTVGNSDATILNAAAQYAAKGWKVFTVGLIASSSVNESLLQEIARNTGGQYFRLTDPQQLVRVYFDILSKVVGGTIIHQESSSLASGETKTLQVTLPSGQTSASFLTQWQGSTVDTTLVEPGGRLITPAVALQDPNIDEYKGLTSQLYQVMDPLAGEWQVRVYGADIPAAGEVVTIQVAVRAPTAIAGNQIVFCSGRGGNLDIYLMNEDGINVRRLTTDPANDVQPEASPDGTRIAFNSDRSGSQHVHVMDLDGGNVREVTVTGSSGWCPRWSPDGTQILYDNDHRIWVINADGTNPRQLSGGYDGFGMSWSPDGQRIVFAHWDSTTDWDLWMMNADGSNKVRLPGMPGPVPEVAPDWSPDGTKLVFEVLGSISSIYSVNLDGTNLVKLSGSDDARRPIWSKDGQRILFYSNRDGNNEIYVMNADGTGVRRLTDDPSNDYDGSWVPARISGVCGTVPSTPYFSAYYGDAILNGQPVPVGAIVETFSPRGDRVGCFQVTNAGLYGYLRVYGEDPTAVPAIPGMRAGEEVTFKINGVQARSSICPVRWYDDKLLHEVDLTGPGACPTEQHVGLHVGWDWFSINRQPASTAPASVLASIAGKYSLVLGEDGTYVPPPADPLFNTLQEIVPGKSYMLRMSQGVTLTVTGDSVVPSTPIQVLRGWRWLGYLPESTLNVSTALANIVGKFDLLLGEGGTYAPPPADPRFNTLSQMASGEGYLIRMSQDGTLVYPATASYAAEAAAAVSGQQCDLPGTPYFTQFYGSVTVDGQPAVVGSLVEAFSPRGDCVGCFEVSTAGMYGYMRAYGEDTSSNPAIPGMRSGEVVVFRVNGTLAEAVGPTDWQDDKGVRAVDLAARTHAAEIGVYLPIVVRGWTGL